MLLLKLNFSIYLLTPFDWSETFQSQLIYFEEMAQRIKPYYIKNFEMFHVFFRHFRERKLILVLMLYSIDVWESFDKLRFESNSVEPYRWSPLKFSVFLLKVFWTLYFLEHCIALELVSVSSLKISKLRRSFLLEKAQQRKKKINPYLTYHPMKNFYTFHYTIYE